MERAQIHLVLKGVALLTGILTFFALRFVRNGWHPEKRILKAYRELSGFLREKSGKSGFYLRSKRWLEKTGAVFHYGRWVEPMRFLALRLILGLAGSLVGAVFEPWYGVIAFLILFFLPVWMLLYLNRRDNERLLPELKLLYHSLEIQIKAGIYVTDALAECYGSVQEKRLRQALLELAGDIVMKADIYDSMERFQGKFDNRYVDSLCITILQALESGQAVELLRDIGEQIKDMEAAVLERKKAALDRRITFCQLGVLTVVLGLALFACVSYMFNAASFF